MLALVLLLGTLHGVVMRGPTQPVCRVGESCEKPAAHVTLFFTRYGKTARTTTDAQGRYRISLTAGTYSVHTDQRPFGVKPQPSTVVVYTARDRRVVFHIDTGIR